MHSKFCCVHSGSLSTESLRFCCEPATRWENQVGYNHRRGIHLKKPERKRIRCQRWRGNHELRITQKKLTLLWSEGTIGRAAARPRRGRSLNMLLPQSQHPKCQPICGKLLALRHLRRSPPLCREWTPIPDKTVTLWTRTSVYPLTQKHVIWRGVVLQKEVLSRNPILLTHRYGPIPYCFQYQTIGW